MATVTTIFTNLQEIEKAVSVVHDVTCVALDVSLVVDAARDIGGLNDQLILADGAALSSSAKAAIVNDINTAVSAVAGYEVTSVSPGTITFLHDGPSLAALALGPCPAIDSSESHRPAPAMACIPAGLDWVDAIIEVSNPTAAING